jgi:lysophospholipase L1-like esterase
VVWPAEEQVTGPETPLNHYQPVIVRVAQETNTPFVDLVPAFRAARDKGALFIDPVHASALGCDVAAAAIASALPPLSALE